MSSMVDRIKRAAMLDKTLYQEVETDTSLNQEALTIVIIASVAGTIGAFIGGLIGGSLGRALLSALINAIMGIANYYIWAYVTYFVGTRFFQGDADPGQMLRTLGYAYAPRLLSLLSFIPCVGPLTGIIAIREALDFDTTKAVITAIIGWVIIVIITAVITGIFGGGIAALTALGNR
jgi:hypothetical protein